MQAYIFPGQGAQFSGMGLDLYENSPLAQELFEQANDILGFSITDVMFEGSDDDLKQTKVTQPAIFYRVYRMLNVNFDRLDQSLIRTRWHISHYISRL